MESPYHNIVVLGSYLHYILNFSCQKLKPGKKSPLMIFSPPRFLTTPLIFIKKNADVERFINMKMEIKPPQLVHGEGGWTNPKEIAASLIQG